MSTRVVSTNPIVELQAPSTEWQLALDAIQAPYAKIYDQAEFGQNRTLAAMSRRDIQVVLRSLGAPEGFNGRTILVGGTGTGREVLTLLQEGAEVIGLDVTLEYLEQTREKVAQADGSLLNRMKLLHCPLESIALTPASLDGVSALFGVLNHVECWESAINNIAQDLKPGSRFVFSVYGPHDATVFKLLAEGKLSYQPSIVQRRVEGGIVLGDSDRVLPTKFPSSKEVIATLEEAGLRIVETQGYLDVAALFPQSFAELEEPAPATFREFQRVVHELDPRYDGILKAENQRSSEIINKLMDLDEELLGADPSRLDRFAYILFVAEKPLSKEAYDF